MFSLGAFRGGFNIYPREVEEVIIRHSAVLEVAVIGVADAVVGEQVAAVVVSPIGDMTANVRGWDADFLN